MCTQCENFETELCKHLRACALKPVLLTYLTPVSGSQTWTRKTAEAASGHCHNSTLGKFGQEEVPSTLPCNCNSSQAFASRRLNFVTAPSRPSNCSPLSPYRQCCSGMIFGSSTAGHSFLDIACRGKGDCLQGKRGIRAAGVLASESALRSEIGWSWGTPTLHQTIAKPLYQDRNWWILGRTPESQNPFIRSEIGGLWGTPGTPTPSQNPFVRTETGGFWGAHRIAKPLYAVHRKTPLSGPDSPTGTLQ